MITDSLVSAMQCLLSKNKPGARGFAPGFMF